jgi:hypothetical protein
MAINTYRFWMATDANRLLANQNAFIQAAAPAFYQGNVAQLELHIVASSGVGTSPVELPFPAGAEISVAVGDTNTYPTGGSWELSVDEVETAPMPYNATTAQVASALNALPSVSNAGGVGVYKTGDGYTITWNTYGLKPTIGIGSDTLTPSSYQSISLVQAGNPEHRQIVFVELRQNPIALGVDWTPLPSPTVTVSEVQAWNGTNKIYRVTISPQPKAGTITIAYGTKTATLAYNASPASITSALSPAQAFATGQYQWDIAIVEDSVLTASGSLVGYNGYSGSINFATAECHQFLAGAERKSTTLEVSMSVDDKRYTLIQTPCNVFADVVSDGVLQPLPLGVALSEQVANARFVRRDIDQNPDASTQDVIWQNLGVETLGSDVAGAINGADSPSAANPFATISDIPTVTSAVWGQITGDIENQSDLDYALTSLDNLKYDKSNPAGFITQADVAGFATQQWVTDQNYLSSSSSDFEFSGYNIAFNNSVKFLGLDGKAPINIGAVFLQPGGTLSNGDMWFNTADGRLGYYYTQQSGSGVRYAATTTDLQSYYPSSNPQGFITASALTPYATNASPALTGTATITNTPGSGGLSVVTSGVNAYTSSLTSSILRVGFLNYQNANAYMTATEVGVGGDATGLARLSTNNTGGANPQLYLWEYGPAAPIQGRSTIIKEGKFFVDNNQGDGPVEVYAPYAVLDTKANLSGAAFTGKVNFATISSSSPSINLGGQCDSAPASATNGDLWISNAASPKLTYRTSGINYNLAVLNQFNTFTGQMVIDTSSSTTAALRVTQRGSGNAIEVEDSTTPDATRFVVDQFGKVGVGTAPDATAAIRVDGNGISFNGLSFNPTGTASHTGGPDTLDLLVTINGVNYRLGLRPA